MMANAVPTPWRTLFAKPGIAFGIPGMFFHRRRAALDRKHGDLILFQTWRIRFADKETVHA